MHKEETSERNSQVTKGKTIDFAQIEVVSGEGDQIPRVDASELEPHTEPLASHVHGKLVLDGVIEGQQDRLFLQWLWCYVSLGKLSLGNLGEGCSGEDIGKRAGDKIKEGLG